MVDYLRLINKPCFSFHYGGALQIVIIWYLIVYIYICVNICIYTVPPNQTAVWILLIQGWQYTCTHDVSTSYALWSFPTRTLSIPMYIYIYVCVCLEPILVILSFPLVYIWSFYTYVYTRHVWGDKLLVSRVRFPKSRLPGFDSREFRPASPRDRFHIP